MASLTAIFDTVVNRAKRILVRRRIRKLVSNSTTCRFHVGCGNDYFSDYINIDVDKRSRADLVVGIENFDLFPDNCASKIESYHFLEHLTLTQAKGAISEWFRMLDSEGELILELPNLEVCSQSLGKHFNANGVDLAMVGIYGYPPDIDRHGVAFQHKWGWSPETLKAILLENGFEMIEEREVRQQGREAFKFGRDMQLAARKGAYNPNFELGLLVSKTHRFVYCPIPKVACTSIKYLMLELDNIQPDEKINREFHQLVHSKYSLSQYDKKERSDILRDGDYTKFVVVRNPWDRLVSAFVDKFVRPSTLEDFAESLVNEVCAKKQAVKEPSLCFREFVEYVTSKKPAELDTHWRPQYCFVGNLSYDVVAKFERMPEDFKEIGVRIGADIQLPEKNRVHKKGGVASSECISTLWELDMAQLKNMDRLPDYTAWYNDDLIDLVRNYYKKDIDTFGYNFDA